MKWGHGAVITSFHYDDVIMGAIASQITSLTIVYSTVYSGADHSKHQSSASLAFVWGIHRGPVNSPHTWPVTRKLFPFDDVIMFWVDLITWLILWMTRICTIAEQDVSKRAIIAAGISSLGLFKYIRPHPVTRDGDDGTNSVTIPPGGNLVPSMILRRALNSWEMDK